MSGGGSVDLAFLTSLPHRSHLRSWSRRLDQLERTLSSLRRQTNPSFEIYVVSDEPLPDRIRSTPHVNEIVVGSFGPASRTVRPSWEELWADKGAKIGVAAVSARNSGARYLMPVDSDDLAHRELAEFVRDNNGDGWFSERGFVLRDGSRHAFEVTERFHLQNGSTHVLRAEGLPLPDDLSADLTRADVLERAGPDNLVSLFGAHRLTEDHLARHGMTLAPLGIPSAMWIIGTGDNYTGRLATSGTRVPLDGELHEAFGVAVPSRIDQGISWAKSAGRRVSARFDRSS